jgi:hypothetical protein
MPYHLATPALPGGYYHIEELIWQGWNKPTILTSHIQRFRLLHRMAVASRDVVAVARLVGMEVGVITSITIGEAIKTAAWKLLNMHGKKLMEGREFPGADVVVMDGKFWANFYHVNPRKNLPAPPANGKPLREV